MDSLRQPVRNGGGRELIVGGMSTSDHQLPHELVLYTQESACLSKRLSRRLMLSYWLAVLGQSKYEAYSTISQEISKMNHFIWH
jgi:hypothetical protein